MLPAIGRISICSTGIRNRERSSQSKAKSTWQRSSASGAKSQRMSKRQNERSTETMLIAFGRDNSVRVRKRCRNRPTARLCSVS
ncbi:MAG: hypothetical protein AW07_00974 [Candidatus Accumulibacter sp. SK-11]|nr:MAG: hypothetical protein AW07_00974 [Candidatus Accumulibacter sp. SK-11]